MIGEDQHHKPYTEHLFDTTLSSRKSSRVAECGVPASTPNEPLSEPALSEPVVTEAAPATRASIRNVVTSTSSTKFRSLRRRLIGGEVQRTVLSIWSWATFGLGVILWLPMVAAVRVVTAPFDKGRYWAGYLFRKLPVVHQHINPLWTFRVSGNIPKDPRRPYIVVSNHESFVDILLISHLPFEMKWLSKAEMFKIPIVGWLMSLAGDIQLTRGKVTSASDAMKQCEDRL
ncbi:MAG: lysophospholipid acyltransferase family protein, partial [Ilumatobacteraceae bacterium]